MKKIDINKISHNTSKEAIIEESLDGKNLDLIFYYVSNFKNTKILRDFIDIIFDKLNLPPNWKSRFILISDEINNNAIEYGSKKGDNNTMKIKTKYNKHKHSIFISIEVEDTGKGKRHKKADQMNQIKEEKMSHDFDNHNSIRGRGLFMIIYRLVDKLHFADSKNGGLIVSIEKEIKL